MRILLSLSILLLISPRIAFAVWGEQFSTSFSTGKAISRSSASFSTPSSYSTSSDNSDYSTAQTFSIPASFQAIINKFDISQAVVPAEAVIQQGLQECLTFMNNNPLEGNDYKAAIIQPITGLLLSGNTYSDKTIDLALSNLYSIASNQRIDYSQKSTMAGQLVKYMEKLVNSSIAGTKDAESANQAMDKIENTLVAILQSKGITVDEQKKIMTEIFDNTTLCKDSPVRTTIAGMMSFIAVAIIEDKDYPLTLIDDSNKDRGKLELAHILEEAVKTNDNVNFSIKVINALNGLLDDADLPSNEVEQVLNITGFILENRGGESYSLKTTCLSTLTKLSGDTRLSEEQRNKATELISTYGLNAYNTTLYEVSGILTIAEDNSLYNSKALNIMTDIISVSPEDTPKLVALQKDLAGAEDAENIKNNEVAVGQYTFDNDIVHLKVQDDYKDSTYVIAYIHEATHYKEDNVMTDGQKDRLTSIWQSADGENDFARAYGQTSKSDFLATAAEAVWTERDLAEKPVLAQAQKQAANGDPTLLEIYELAQEVWNLS
jgi:hypothetical protein